MSEDILSEVRRDYIYRLIKNGDRIGGREADEYRDVSVEKGIIARAEGSARVKIGNTDVLAGIKAQIGEPFPDTPDKGVIITNAELVPLASPSFEAGPPDENGVELAFTYGDINFYAKVGFSQITEELVKAPHKLGYPEGWLAQSLVSDTIEPITGPSSCVEAFNNPELW